MASVEVAGIPSDLVSHGMCDTCARRMEAGTRQTARDFLEQLDTPVFLTDGDVRIVAANSAARALVSKGDAEIEDRLSGDVIECANAYKPGGCGNTVHCKACAIRNTVTETMNTGRPQHRVAAFQTLRTDDGEVEKQLRISTERAGSFVLLTIEDESGAS
jgi:PAS domain-containing protein